MMTIDPLLIDFPSKNNLLKLCPEAPLLSSNPEGWDGIQFQYHRQPAYKIVENSCRQHRIIIHDRALKLPMMMTIENLTELTQITCGTITIIPANARNWACWDAEHQFMVLMLEPNRLKQDTAEGTNGTDVELLPTFSHTDSLIYNLGLALKTELESNQAEDRLYIDAILAALIAHLLRHYSIKKYTLEVTNGLPKSKLQQVVDYIHDFLEQDLTLAKLAAVVPMSPSHFSSSLKHSTGLAPHQYVIQCRVEQAKQLLVQNKLTIAEIAYSLGFAHQSHLSRHFKRLVGVTPKAFLKSQ
ncbi:MAG: AraC family transcriptional regulator [Nostoc sp.]